MQTIREGLQAALAFIEAHLDEEISVHDVAAHAYVSAFHFQRIFSALCGMPLGEYIRGRRLTLAAQELMRGARVIDAALKYGYDSPDSFTRAFTKFHGVSPSAAKEKGAAIKSFAPIRIKLTLEGGTIMEYRIVEKAAFTIMGKCRSFNSETSYAEIPPFWHEHYQNGGGEIIKGMFGACVDSDGKNFDYYIADLYFPWNEIPEGCTTKTFPSGTWAVFPYHGECPKALQDVNTKIWSEWLPNCKEYELAGSYNMEFYIDQQHGEIWVPVKKK